MSFRIISRQDVKKLLPMTKCIELVEYAHKQLQYGNAEQPLRSVIWSKEGKGVMATMPAYIAGQNEVMGLKTVTVFPGNHEIGLESHQGAIVLMNPENGLLMSVMDAAEITALRTAAASAVATKYLSPKNASALSLIGAGVQAHSHLRAISCILDLEEIKVWNRTSEKADKFVSLYSNEFNINSVTRIEDALDVDIICTLTASRTPLFDIDYVKAGSHINAVGSSQPDTREIGSGFVTKASWFTDVKESILNEAGELLIPKSTGEIDDFPEIIELGALISGDHIGRKSIEEITVYKSLGIGIQDLICAQYAYSQAEEQDIGQTVNF